MAPAEGSSNGSHKRQLVGFDNFKRSNPMTDRFEALRFHHIEFYCGDANTTFRRFQWGLGMQLVAKSDMSTGNQQYASYVLQSNELVFTFTAPYSAKVEKVGSKEPHPGYSQESARDFLNRHGLGVRAVGILVGDAEKAYEETVRNGAEGVMEPTELMDSATGKAAVVSEIKAYGDVVLRFISSKGFDGPFLPNYEPVQSFQLSYGLERLDHAVGNVPHLLETIDYLANATGFHEFAEFTAEDIGTVDSGLNSMVLASNNERVIMPVNEPTFGTKRKSQIQTYLEHNEGPGLQHLALKCDDIFATLREMRKRSEVGGFEFMPRPSDKYYRNLPEKVGGDLTPEQLKECEELGILVDKDDQGILLQIFTKPLGDRPTIFIEIIQRIGCTYEENGKMEQKGGCGGFGKGNFSELFKSIEDYERTLDAKV